MNLLSGGVQRVQCRDSQERVQLRPSTSCEPKQEQGTGRSGEDRRPGDRSDLRCMGHS